MPKAARRPDQLATQFIAAIARLYAVEAKAKGKEVAERAQLRETLSRPILAEIQHLLVTHRVRRRDIWRSFARYLAQAALS